jgi:hypothetical protein
MAPDFKPRSAMAFEAYLSNPLFEKNEAGRPLLLMSLSE